MQLKIKRIIKPNCTIGELYIDNIPCFYTLEDVVRTLPKECPYTVRGLPCKCEGKINGQTAIPAGVYKVRWSYSPHFKKYLPEVLNVPHFLGIRIHAGNSVEDSSGCILVGMKRNGDRLTDSRIACSQLFPQIEDAYRAGEDITLEIE